MSTIAAIATPPGQGGVGIIRLSGPGSREILRQSFRPRSRNFSDFQPWRLHRGEILDARNDPIDDALVVFMPSPATFTGEDVAEIHCHGGELLAQLILEAVLDRGARQAERGEFSRRAFLNGRMDLSQAEAVAELVAAPSREALLYGLNRLHGYLGEKVRVLRDKLDELRALAYAGVDFPDDEIMVADEDEFARRVEEIIQLMDELLKGASRAEMMQHGASVVLAGPVNAGKSSILNALLGRKRALVADIPGTTRDFIEERVNLQGLPVKMIDTAGFRPRPDANPDPVEALGVDESREAIKEADLVLLVVDATTISSGAAPDNAILEILSLAPRDRMLAVFNKCDLCAVQGLPQNWPAIPCQSISALTGENMDALVGDMRKFLLTGAKKHVPENGIAPNRRQAKDLECARAEMIALLADTEAGAAYDCRLARLDVAASRLDEILGLSDHDELLDKIFQQFCIGK